MTAFNGVVAIKPRGGEIGQLQFATSSFTLTGGLANTDTITIDLALPEGGAEVLSMTLDAPELDSHGSPTMTFTVGDGHDADGYFTTTSGGAIISNLKGRGALIGTRVTSRKIVLTVTAAVATAVTSGTIYFDYTFRT
jgi:hypothetical protein